MQLILSSTETLVTVAISTAPDGGFHCKSMCAQTKPAPIPHNMLKVKVKVSRLYPPNEGSLAGEPPVRFEPRTHRLRRWTANFPSQVPRRLLENPEHISGCQKEAKVQIARWHQGATPFRTQVRVRESA